MSNTERQRLFRERNPGYYGRLHRKRNARIEQLNEQLTFEAWWKARIDVKTPLMLPAPEQVHCTAGDALMQQIRDAVARRREASVPVERGDEPETVAERLPA